MGLGEHSAKNSENFNLALSMDTSQKIIESKK